MSKWHKVELTPKQFEKLCDEWDSSIENPDEGRVKVRQYRIYVDSNGQHHTESLGPNNRKLVPAKEITYVYKFKDSSEAMAFKLAWS